VENNLVFTPLSLNGARQIKYYFRTSTGNSTVLMRCHNYGGYVTVNGANYVIWFSYPSILTSCAPSIHFRVIISRGPYVCANNIRFCQIGNGARRAVPLRYINGRNDYFSASTLRRSQSRMFRVSQLFSQIAVSTQRTTFLVFLPPYRPFFYFFFTVEATLSTVFDGWRTWLFKYYIAHSRISAVSGRNCEWSDSSKRVREEGTDASVP